MRAGETQGAVGEVRRAGGEELLQAQTRLNEYADKVRDVLGVEFVRREFLPVLRA
ncbi:MAG: hypothetical protein IPK44_25015 [Candidatus Accumulibacter sp.]|uniref:hypothetical protein n=1 Tax=Accumulibacter sp. TaxID=2053492 RepID=UPI00258AAB41|nr:hypothetical protein [Accumulibacter sp.]MBK8117552.1 hypothetical protein [Accumulibacter sp.]